jgi:hypothetical protein
VAHQGLSQGIIIIPDTPFSRIARIPVQNVPALLKITSNRGEFQLNQGPLPVRSNLRKYIEAAKANNQDCAVFG